MELRTTLSEDVYTFRWDAPMDSHLPRLFPGLDPPYRVQRLPPESLAKTELDGLRLRPRGAVVSTHDVVHLLVIGDGYVAADLGDNGTYACDVERVVYGLFAEPPFSWYREAFEVRALFLQSRQSGCDTDAAVDDVDTALDVRPFEDTGLAVHDMERLHALVAAAGGADLVLVLANTDRSAGLGEPRVAIVAARPTDATDIAAHEVGHAFAGLGHECVEVVPPVPVPASATSFETYLEGETTKWEHFLRLPGAERFERSRSDGRDRGRWRTCRMQSGDEPFCPVCSEIVARAIHEECGLEWDDDAFHEAHPLAQWKE